MELIKSSFSKSLLHKAPYLATPYIKHPTPSHKAPYILTQAPTSHTKHRTPSHKVPTHAPFHPHISPLTLLYIEATVTNHSEAADPIDNESE